MPSREPVRGRVLADRLLAPAAHLNAGLVLAFLYLPVAVLVVFSFSASRYAAVWGGVSTRWYATLFANREIGHALVNSLVIAAATAAVATLLGTLLALGLHRRAARRSTAALDAAVVTPIVVPDVVQGVSLLLFFVLLFALVERVTGTRPALGRATVIAGHTAFAVSYVALLVRARLRVVPAALREAALDLGATPAEAFRRVTLPLIRPAVVGGALLAFTLSLDEFVITFFTSGPTARTLPVMVWSMVKRGVTPEINALSALLVVSSIVLVTISALLQRER